MRAIHCISVSVLCLAAAPSFAMQTLACMSDSNAFRHCGLANADQRDIRIQSVKAGDCEVNNAWGVDSTGIWVDKGCGAVFEYTQVAGTSPDSSNSYEDGPAVYVAPDYVGPYYGPGFYYGAGFYDYNGWNNNNNYCSGHNCNNNQQHNNQNNDNNEYHPDNAVHNEQHNTEDHPQEMYHGDEGFHGGEYHGGAGGFHGGGGGRR